MDRDTGEVKQFENKKALAKEQGRRRGKGFKPLIELDKEPDPNCKEKGCFGKGWIGRDVDTGDVIPCKCVLSDTRKELR